MTGYEVTYLSVYDILKACFSQGEIPQEKSKVTQKNE